MVLNRKEAADKEKLKEVKSYREAFDHYDWTIPIKVKDLTNINKITAKANGGSCSQCLCMLNSEILHRMCLQSYPNIFPQSLRSNLQHVRTIRQLFSCDEQLKK